MPTLPKLGQYLRQLVEQSLTLLAVQVRHLHHSRPEKTLSGYARHLRCRHESLKSRLASWHAGQESHLTISFLRSFRFNRAYDFTGGNQPYASMAEEHDISWIKILNVLLDVTVGRNPRVFHHFPDSLLIVGPVGVKQNTLHCCGISVPIIWQGEEFKIVVSADLVDTVRNELDRKTLAFPVLDRTDKVFVGRAPDDIEL